MQTRIETGRWGEDRAADYLRSLGYTVIARNWRGAAGEVDIVAALGGRTAIVEVKTRRGTGFGHPLEAITPIKLHRLRVLAAQWGRENPGHGPLRIDAVAVVGTPASWRIEHLTAIG
ncbi:YraN family protein [Mycetocola reblochoni]|uniref:UPF0102 protein FM119_06640 n=2 Tax=Mycetocola reblochoni TaxID=331618 RepID=A0A1R4JBU9_9MICO|nr:YraN family protein [Mycetocola reblochoni]RLP69988.1 YraN family protein [Mycetocola reblochoni]SJN29527.1 Endonuclease [Mycetocola reblochoni REB411]